MLAHLLRPKLELVIFIRNINPNIIVTDNKIESYVDFLLKTGLINSMVEPTWIEIDGQTSINNHSVDSIIWICAILARPVIHSAVWDLPTFAKVCVNFMLIHPTMRFLENGGMKKVLQGEPFGHSEKNKYSILFSTMPVYLCFWTIITLTKSLFSSALWFKYV